MVTDASEAYQIRSSFYLLQSPAAFHLIVIIREKKKAQKQHTRFLVMTPHLCT